MFELVLVALTVVVATAVAVQALRRPILFRMALRNALRRPRQTATVVAGLMIGTAIISAALVAGSSASSAIRGAVYDALGPVDETVRMDGLYFFDEAIEEELLSDPAVAAYFDAVAPNILWQGAADNPRTDLFEPGVQLVGFDPQKDAAFGDFETPNGAVDGTAIRPGQAIATGGLADKLDLRVGDEVRIAYTLPMDPLLPRLSFFGGLLQGSDPASLVPALSMDGPSAATHPFEVTPGATRAAFLLTCGSPDSACPPGTQIRLTVTDPDGQLQATGNLDAGDCLDCTPTLALNLTPSGPALKTGAWSLHVAATVAINAPYTVVAAPLYPEYDLEAFQNRIQELRELAPDAEERFTDGFEDPLEATVRIAAVTTGGRGDQFDFDEALFLPLPEMQELLHRPGQVNLLKFSNPGGTQDGAAGTDQAERLLATGLESVRAARAGEPAPEHITVNPVKQEFLELADQAGKQMTGLLIFAGSLSILTGLLLIINIFTMLAEERRSELGMARAVGLSRRDLVRLFLFEGSLYAVAAAAIGAVLGLGLAYLMVLGVNAVLASQAGGFPPIPFSPGTTALPVAFSAGALLTFGTIYVASRRQSRLNIVRAIRQIDEPDRPAKSHLMWFGIPLVLAGFLLSLAGWAVGQFSLQVFAPLALALGLRFSLAAVVRRRVLDPLFAALLALYYVATIFLISEFSNLQEANVVGPVRGVLLTLAIVVVLSHWEAGPRWLGRALGRIRSLRAVALPSVAYPQHKRFRTGMTLAMFSLVILSIGFFSIFGALFQVDPARHTGGFDVEGTTTLRVEDLDGFDRGLVDADLIQSRHDLVDHRVFDRDFITVEGGRTGQYGPPIHHVYGIDEEFLAVQEFDLLWTLDGISTEQTYQRLFTEPGTIIVSYPYSTDETGNDLAHEVGDTLEMHFGDDVREYTIIGIQEQYHFQGVWLPFDEADDLFPQADRMYLWNLAEGADAEAVAKDLERNYRDAGLDAEASQELVAKEQESFRQILGAMKLFLGLGLVVGVLSLGIVTSRAVLERRQEIGMLRALGFTRQEVRRIFFIEVTFVVVLGALIGILSSLVVTYGLWFAIIRDLHYPYVVPWAEIGVLLLASYTVALLATAAPILRAARVAPAEALRYVD